MAGYNGWSMSWNAVDAYENGEKPLSKWSKKEIIIETLLINEKLDVNLLNKVNTSCLRNLMLKNAGWHHTSKFYNKTNFYKIDEEFVENLTNDKLINSINRQIIGKEKGSVLGAFKRTAYVFKRRRIWFWVSSDCQDFVDVWNREIIKGFEVGDKNFFFKNDENKWDVAFKDSDRLRYTTTVD